jgi:DNA-binding transcriptional LysR family regulator
MDRLTSMSVFVKVAEAGSFAAVADALGLSAPMVGKHVRFLEDRLGTRLINRTTRRQTLTDFGRVYYDRCKLVLAEDEAAEALAEDLLGVPCGPLRVSMPVLFGRRCVAPILLKLVQQHPKLELNLFFSDRPVDLMEDAVDLAIRNGSVGEGTGLVTRRIVQQRMTVCASPKYLATHGTPRSIPDLEQHQAVIYSRSGRSRAWLFPLEDGGSFEVTPKSRLRFDDLEAIADAAVLGIGLAWLPCWLVRDRVQSGALVRVLTEYPGLVLDSYALWLQTPYLPLRIRVAVDALAAELPGIMEESAAAPRSDE